MQGSDRWMPELSCRFRIRRIKRIRRPSIDLSCVSCDKCRRSQIKSCEVILIRGEHEKLPSLPNPRRDSWAGTLDAVVADHSASLWSNGGWIQSGGSDGHLGSAPG